MKQLNWTRILTILLVILAAYAVLYVTGTVLARFRHVFVIFILGALTAYVLYPMVKRLEVLLRVRWLAILTSYVILAAGLFTLGVFLFTPFIQQSQSLVDNLQNPSSGSLQNFVSLECRARQVERDLRAQTQPVVCGGLALAPGNAASAPGDIGALQIALSDLRAGIITGRARVRIVGPVTPGRQPPNPPDQTGVPSSYVKAIATQVDDLVLSYDLSLAATGDTVSVDVAQAIAHARRAQAAARSTYTIMSNTPILLIRSQSWLDDHGIQVNIHDRFGDAATQLSNQGSLLVNNAVTIVQTTANTLLNTALILIVAFYLMIDGARLVNRGVTLVPAAYRDQVWYFVTSLDRVLGGYIRGQLFLSALAGLLGGAGAAALGVPYPLLIGILTFLLETVPVIGPIAALLPAVLVSLFFEPVITTVLLLGWNMVFQQVVTNILGPRIMGIAVGIHPLEAMGAVLVGYPLAGFLGALLAVPVAGILHIVVRELYAYFALGRALPTATPDIMEVDKPRPEDSSATVAKSSGARPAAN